MSLHNIKVGQSGEQLAHNFLISKGYIIIGSNIRNKYGEIDIVCKKNNVIVFVEVKTRHSLSKGKPYESFTYRKSLHVKRSAEFYVLQNKLSSYKLSLKVISIELRKDNEEYDIKDYDFDFY